MRGWLVCGEFDLESSHQILSVAFEIVDSLHLFLSERAEDHMEVEVELFDLTQVL